MKLFNILLFVCISFTINAQNKLDIANRYYNDYAYYQALDIYLKINKTEPTNTEILERIGDCYYNNSNTEKSTKWYSKAIESSNSKNPKLIYKYIQSLKSVKKYDEAYKWLSIYNELQGIETEDAKTETDYLTILDKLNKPLNKYIKVINLETNTGHSEFSSFYNGDELYLASTTIDSSYNKSKKTYVWNNEPFLGLYVSKTKFTKDSIISNPGIQLKGDNINTKFHEANAVITKDGQTLYFTRDNLKKKNKLNPNKEGTVHLMLYRATLVDKKWSNLEALPFNDSEFSNGHPMLSNDDKTLFFVSDQPNGYGATDLYKVSINDDNTFGTPENLGNTVNSSGREMFPFIDSEDNLYFSSDSHTNLGLLDIFKSNYLTKKEDENSEITNIGAPYNSSYDDFSFYIDPKDNKGFFTSDRPGGKGSDDIYAFLTLICEQTVFGIITDELTKLPIPNVTVRLIDKEGKVARTTNTNSEGYYEVIDVPCEKYNVVVANKDNYKPNNKNVTTTVENGKRHEVNMELTPLIIDNEIVVNPIYFDFNKYNIRQDSYYELENIVNVLKSNPEMVIKIQSHTDSRGRDAYNKKLSNQRANATSNYILSRDIPSKQIESAIGYGESQLLNKCGNRVKCSEEEHQLNRRSKFIIVKR